MVDSRRPCTGPETRQLFGNPRSRGRCNRQGSKPSPSTCFVYFNETTNVRVVVHVDDFLCTGPEQGLADLRRRLDDKYVIKFEIFGVGAHEKKAGHLLGRTIRWTELALTYTGDGTLLEGLLDEWNVRAMRKRVMFGRLHRN